MRRWFPFVSAADQITDGVNDAAVVSTRHLAHWNSPTSPYLLANEWICGNIANFLRLQIPPFSLFREGRQPRSRKLFGSLWIDDIAPPDTIAEKCVRQHPRDCAGIVVFDILVANSDRHKDNLRVDDPLEPSEVFVYDHDRAFFGYVKGEAASRLDRLTNRLGITGGSQSTGNAHCLIEHLSSSDDIRYWAERVETIPLWFIEEVCNDECVPIRLRDAGISFLRHRKDNIRKVISSNRDQFPGVKDWGIF